MHENELTHTDLKPENILFDNSDYDLVYNTKKVFNYFLRLTENEFKFKFIFSFLRNVMNAW